MQPLPIYELVETESQNRMGVFISHETAIECLKITYSAWEDCGLTVVQLDICNIAVYRIGFDPIYFNMWLLDLILTPTHL